MKKLLALVLALCLVLGLGGCRFINKTTAPVEFTSADSGTLYWHSMELAGLLGGMLRTPGDFGVGVLYTSADGDREGSGGHAWRAGP